MPTSTLATGARSPFMPAPDARAYLEAASGVRLAGLIKLRDADWGKVPAARSFLHLNAAPCTNTVGGIYAMTRIESAGAAGSPALMDVRQWTLVECKSLRSFENSLAVPHACLSTLVGAPATHDELLTLMLSRYRGLRPEWDEAPGGSVVLCEFEHLSDSQPASSTS